MRTERMREAHDDLDLDPGISLPVGQPVSLSYESVTDEEMDGDLLIDEPESDEQEESEPVPLDDAPDTEERGLQEAAGPLFAPSDLLGTRPPPVHVRLHVVGDLLVAEPMFSPDPRRRGEADAIAELVALVSHAFRAERRADWCPLLEDPPPNPVKRLMILVRLALPPCDPIPLPNGGDFCPYDLQLSRFRRKFALFPDGIPFCLRLLLPDERGRHKDEPRPSRISSGLLELPDPVILAGLQQALDEEQARGTPEDDAAFGKRLRRTLNEMGVRRANRDGIGIILDKEIRTLRDRLRRWRDRAGEGGRELFPNKVQRRQRYGRLSEAGKEVVG